MCGGTFERKPVGELLRVAALGSILSPQRPQNREFCGSELEHRGQGNEFGVSPGLTITNERFPHRPQNFTPSANREPQFEHATIPGIKLELAPPLLLPCDGDGWLPVSLSGFNCA